MVEISKTIYFFFDDSGVLSKNEPSKHFVYAGYVFQSREDLDVAKRKYIHANKMLRRAYGLEGELKAAILDAPQKRSLFNSTRAYESLSVEVDISRVYDYILNSKKSICRYKDYVLKRCVKSKLQDFIRRGILSRADDVCIRIYIDEQLTATNGYYDLRDSISEELQYGIINFDYGVTHQNVFTGKVAVEIKYCDSKTNYLIQASDILANRIWTSYRVGNAALRNIPNHTALTFP